MFLPLFFLFRRRILLKPSYNSCSGAITCTNMISHGMPDSACKKVFACKVKTANLFSLQLQQNFLVQQCFLPLFFLFCRRILLKPSYNSCGDEITCTNIFYKSCLTVLQTLLLAKLKRQIYFHCNYSKIFLVQQCFCRCFPFSVVGFYSNRLTTVAVVQLLVQT